MPWTTSMQVDCPACNTKHGLYLNQDEYPTLRIGIQGLQGESRLEFTCPVSSKNVSIRQEMAWTEAHERPTGSVEATQTIAPKGDS